ncbi:MAG: DUF3800 domain-containing protein [Caulobacteraceae bacterium]|nr:DUF3800 domain-containing protein [Caulobacteraceae bacterium]
MLPWLEMIPRYERNRRFAVLVCHLDDSGEKREPIVTLAGYLGTAANWSDFEQRATAFFNDKGVDYLHTVELHHLRGEFEGWDRDETLAFATTFFEMVADAAPVGLEFSVLKSIFNRNKSDLKKVREGSPATFCFKGLLQNMMCDEAIQTVLAMDGVDLSFVVESGPRSEPILKDFNRLKAAGAFRGVLRSMTIEDKKKFKGLQAADFLAYFSRRLRCMDKWHPHFNDELAFFQAATRPIAVHSHFLATAFS